MNQSSRRSQSDAGILIRDPRKSDLPALLAIYNDVVKSSHATFDLVSQTLTQRKKWFSEHGGRFPLVVAEMRGEVIGYASISVFRDKPAYSLTGESSVYVHQGFRGKGVGALLMKEIVARARNLGYHTIIAGIAPPNEPSVRLHESLGFKFVGNFKEVGFKFRKWRDVVFYQLMLEGQKGRRSPGSPGWKYVGIRRLAIFIEESVYNGTQWAVFEPNDEGLWSRIRSGVEGIMQDLFLQGKLSGSEPKQAYFVKCGPDTTTQADVDRGVVNIVVGYAPLRRAEFVILRIQQGAGQKPHSRKA